MKRAEYPEHVEIWVSAPKPGAREPYCKVKKGVTKVAYGGTVTFRFRGAFDGALVFAPTPKGASRPFPEARGDAIRIPAGGRTLRVVSRPRRARKGPLHYPYALYSPRHNCFAKGSLPRMMVGP